MSRTPNNTNFSTYQTLVSALQLVAAPYQQQIDALPDFVCVPDEVALIFDDAYLAARAAIEGKPETVAVLRLLDDLNEQFDKMPADSEMWTLEALRTRPEWEMCRTSSTRILSELNEPLQSPRLDVINFVKSAEITSPKTLQFPSYNPRSFARAR